MSKDDKQLALTIEALLMAAHEPLSVANLLGYFPKDERPEAKEVKETINALQEDYSERAVELKQLASGYCFQVRKDYAPYIAKLFEEKPPRYSRALLETLVIIAYKQPITRAEIEDVRGVAVSSTIIHTLCDRGWVKVVGHREVPGKPEILGTTKDFLDYFNLKSLKELPTLDEIQELDKVADQLAMDLEMPAKAVAKEDETESEVAEEESDELSDSEALDAEIEVEIEPEVEPEAESLS